MFACNGAVPVPGRIPGTLEVLERGSARSIYSTPLRGSSLSITHIFGWTTAGNHRHGTDGHMDFDTCALSSETALERPGHSCQFHIDHISGSAQLSSHERRVTCQWCHMGAHPRHYNTPPMGAHPRGRLLDAARATFTDPATPEDGLPPTRTMRRYCSS